MLAGLDEVDAVFFEFANAIEGIIRTGRSGRCSRSNGYLCRMLRFFSGDLQQGYGCCSVLDFRGVSDKPRIILYPSRSISSFDEGPCQCFVLPINCTNRNFYPSRKSRRVSFLVEFNETDLSNFLLCSIHEGYLLICSQSIQDSDNPEMVFKPFLLLGLLANYNRFEFRNPYRLRLEDFVNESAIQKIVQGIGSACSQSRNYYVAVQEDVAEGWTVGSTLAYIGLGVLTPSKGAVPTQPKADDMKEGFAML